MSPTEHQLFERTRERIRTNLVRIAALSKSALGPGEYFSRFLELACDCLNAKGGAFWSTTTKGFRALAVRNFESSGYDADPLQKEWIDSVLSATASSRRPHIVAADEPGSPRREMADGEIGNRVPYPFFYEAVAPGGNVSGVLQIWLPGPGDPRTYQDITKFLRQLVTHAETYLQGWQGAQLAARNDLSRTMLDMQSELLGQLEPKTIELVSANFSLDLLGADLACLFERKGKQWRLAAASNQEVVDARSLQSRALSRMADSLEPAPNGALVSKDAASEDLAALLEECGMIALAWVHFSSSRRAAADRLLLAARNDGEAFPPEAESLIKWAGEQAGKALDAATHFQHLPLRPITSRVARARRAWSQRRHLRVLALTGLPVLAVTAALFFPVPWKLSAACSVVPERDSKVIAESSGKITTVNVQEGESVEPGQILATIDDADYATQLAVAHQDLLRWKVEAGKAQALGNEAERKIAELSIRRQEEEIARLEYLRSRTRLVSPIAGTVVTRDLHNREGEAIEPGVVFCEVAGSGEYEVKLMISQADLGDLLGRLRDGSALNVDFILHAYPMTTLHTKLSGPDSVSMLPVVEPAGSFFTAKAPFPNETTLQGRIKPGYTGKAKVIMGNRPLAWVIGKPFLDYVRTHWAL